LNASRDYPGEILEGLNGTWIAPGTLLGTGTGIPPVGTEMVVGVVAGVVAGGDDTTGGGGTGAAVLGGAKF
jgi:hypothetical protein